MSATYIYSVLFRRLTILHNITNDAKLVEVAATAFGTERLFKGNLYIVDVVPVPGSAKELVTKSQDQDVLHHLLTQVVVDTEDLIFHPIRRKSLLELTRAAKILTERLLDLRDGY